MRLTIKEGNRALRGLFCGIVLLVAAACRSQIPIRVGADMAGVLRDNNFLATDVHSPLQPTGDPGLEPKDGTQFVDLGQSNDFQYRHADTVRTAGPILFLEGDCLFLVRGYRVSCDSVQYDRIANTATLRGHVHVDGELFAITQADAVTIDFANNSYIAKQGEAQLTPKLVQGRLRDKIYVKGRESYGTEGLITTVDGLATTCNYPVPHYDIEAQNIVLRPGRRVIFRKTKIRILGYVVANLPFLSIPLEERTSRYVPYVGQSPDEGYFAKWTLGIPTKNPNYNIQTHEDFMSKLGIGLGADYSYLSRLSAGTLSLYHIFGKSDDLVFSNIHKQVFGWGTLSVQTDYEKDNYLVAPNSTVFSTKVGALIPQGLRTSTQINLSDATTTTQGYTTTSRSLALQDRRDFGGKLTTNADINYFDTGSTYANSGATAGNQTTQRLDVHLQAQKDLELATAALEYQRSIPIGSTKTFVGGADETPVLSLSTDARRLLGSKLGGAFPFQSLVSWGEFQDPRDNTHVTRTFFDFNFNKIDPSRKRFKVDMNGDFKQGIYSDNTAEYVLTYGTNLRYDLGQNTGINLRYNYMRPYGYSPLSMDQTGQTNYLSTDLNVRPIKSLLLGAQTGYDILRLKTRDVPWQQIGLRSEFQPEKWFMLRGLYTYDTYARKWQSIRLDLTYLPGATRLTLGAVFDGEQHTWSTANVFLDNFKWGRLRTSTALSYNGYLKKFDSKQFNFIYDLHCAEAVFELQENNTGFRSGRQYGFFIRLKAIPYDVPFGVGTRGQPVGFNNGTSF